MKFFFNKQVLPFMIDTAIAQCQMSMKFFLKTSVALYDGQDTLATVQHSGHLATVSPS